MFIVNEQTQWMINEMIELHKKVYYRYPSDFVVDMWHKENVLTIKARLKDLKKQHDKKINNK